MASRYRYDPDLEWTAEQYLGEANLQEIKALIGPDRIIDIDHGHISVRLSPGDIGTVRVGWWVRRYDDGTIGVASSKQRDRDWEPVS